MTIGRFAEQHRLRVSKRMRRPYHPRQPRTPLRALRHDLRYVDGCPADDHRRPAQLGRDLGQYRGCVCDSLSRAMYSCFVISLRS